MLAARELYNLTGKWFEDFSRHNGAGNAAPEEAVKTQYVAIVCMMRAIGHVLQKVDCDQSLSPSRNAVLRHKWRLWKQEPIFANFIEPARNRLLKEFEGGLELEGQDGATCAISGPSAQRHWWFDAKKIRDSEGRLIAEKFRQALEFWDRALSEMEAIPE